MNSGLTLRSAFILGCSGVAGSVSGTAADAIAEGLAHPVPGLCQLVTAAGTLWFAGRLDRLIVNDEPRTRADQGRRAHDS